jgi:hypothetical protein
MSWAKIRGKLGSRIGSEVSFGAPRDVAAAGGERDTGRIVDEVWVDQALNESPPRQGSAQTDWGDYSFCAQLIEWHNGQRAIRLAYYRRRVGEDWWELASQTTVCSDPETVRKLCELTLTKSEWFRFPALSSRGHR